MNVSISFSYQTSFPKIKNIKVLKKFIHSMCIHEGYEFESLSIVFCSDTYLHSFNIHYLKHDTLTDIITFDYADNPNIIHGELYISYQRVKENAIHLKIPIYKELHRVLFHGILHLLGYKDKLKQDVEIMRNKEEYYLTLYFSNQKCST